MRMISGVKSARFGIENVGQPETVTITETLQMSSVLPTVLLLAWPVHWEFPAWSVGLSALQYRGRQQKISSRREKQLCGCITRFSSFLCRPLQDNDVKLPNLALYGVHKDGSFLSVLVGRGFEE